MPTLASELRNKLERAVIAARDAAEAGARAALEALAVHHYEPYAHMKPGQRELRNHLRARARQLGDRQDRTSRIAIDHLAGECAYEHWHRMLFARFLAENGLLIEPQENMAISLAEAEELAAEVGVDVWVFASRCAQGMLPQIFRPDDPLLQIAFATEHMLKLEKLLASLPAAVFTASDALGWVYQFWQSKKKDQVNRSEVKIGADEISAVTQLFTEPYMVEFLLHNTLGAWHAGKVLPALSAEALAKADEASLRKACALPGVEWAYLRFVREEPETAKEAQASDKANPQSAIRSPQSHWRPAAGTFDGWPKTAAELKVLDPCCGSGHFLVAALHHLAPIRMAEEGLSVTEAVDAVLRDNLHGLEIDERCCQIAAFALALAAWTYPDAGGYRPLPDLHIACTGIGPQSTQEQWVKLATESGVPMPTVGREAIKNGLLNLHRLFSQAPTLGSLINPAELPADLIAADYETIQPYLTAIRAVERMDDETRERAIAAAGMVKAADLLAGEYTLVITNVPYLLRGKQNDVLKSFAEQRYDLAKNDLATMSLERCLSFNRSDSTTAAVLPQTWLRLTTYRKFREHLLKSFSWNALAELGPRAFETISGEVVNVILLAISHAHPSQEAALATITVAVGADARTKSNMLRSEAIALRSQLGQLQNPDARVILDGEAMAGVELLRDYVDGPRGLATGDDARYLRKWWELASIAPPWAKFLTTPDVGALYSGRQTVLFWEDGTGVIAADPGARVQGQRAWGKTGLLVSCVHPFPVSITDGEIHSQSTAVLLPNARKLLPAVFCRCTDTTYPTALRALDKKVFTTPATLAKVDFDCSHWEQVAAKKYPDGLPEPESDDPTQWLFHGRPDEAQEGAELHVAVARLLGYRWPAELDEKMRLSKRARALVKKCGELAKFADNDGIVCIPAVRGEEPAAERLLKVLAACDIELESDFDLDDWLRNGFFEEHCKLFHDRPFVWHIWDGRKRDGFGALANYHKLCGVEAASSRFDSEKRQDAASTKGRRLLESLTYAYLGEWITRQRDGVKRGEGGAEDRLAAALELQKRLEAILAGEPPFDLFVRWKPLAEQPIGWEPDINDGVRVNIRPFLASDLPAGLKGAGVLRVKPKGIKWTKDRGKEPKRPKAEYPWFWNWDEKTEDFMGTGKEPDGNRHNACHYTNTTKQAAREVAEDD